MDAHKHFSEIDSVLHCSESSEKHELPAEGELQLTSTVSKMEIVRKEGKREVRRTIELKLSFTPEEILSRV